MTTPKELADKAKRYARYARHGSATYEAKTLLELNATIDQLQVMAEAHQATIERLRRVWANLNILSADIDAGPVRQELQDLTHALRIHVDSLEPLDGSYEPQGSGEPVADGDYYSEEADDIAQSRSRAAPPSAQQATGSTAWNPDRITWQGERYVKEAALSCNERDTLAQQATGSGQVLTDEQRQAVADAAGYFSRSWKSEDAKLANKLRTILAAATQAQPVIHAQFECVADGITGSTDAPIKRVEQNDDGSFTVTIDHWPRTTQAQPEVPSPVGLTRTDGKLRASVMRREANGNVTCVAMAEVDEAELTYTLKAVADALATAAQAQPLATDAGVRGVDFGDDSYRRTSLQNETRGRPVMEDPLSGLAARSSGVEGSIVHDATPTTGKREPLTHRLFDSQWVNVVNAPEVLNADDAQAAVAAAVKLTEQAMAKNIAADSWPSVHGITGEQR